MQVNGHGADFFLSDNVDDSFLTKKSWALNSPTGNAEGALCVGKLGSALPCKGFRSSTEQHGHTMNSLE